MTAMVASFRHSLRFRAQLLCQLSILTALLQAEMVRACGSVWGHTLC